MIVPGDWTLFFKIKGWSLAWSVVFINIFVYMFSVLFFSSWQTEALQKQLQDRNFTDCLVKMYRQTLDTTEKKIRTEVTYQDVLQDHRFWAAVKKFPFTGDQIQIEKVRKILFDFKEQYYNSSQFQLGLGLIESSPWAWVTYQFSHASWWHLFGNIIIIFLLISYLETRVELFYIVTVYLFGGFCGGIAFLFLDGAGSLSVVGASASAMALMSFLLISQINEVMPWSYFIGPFKQGYGVIHLPVFFILPFFILHDLIDVVFNSTGVTSSVANSAHIGGALAGLILGLMWKLNKTNQKFFCFLNSFEFKQKQDF